MENSRNFEAGPISNFNEQLSALYNDPSSPAGFSNPKTLYFYAKKLYPNITYKDVFLFLKKSNVFSSFKLKKNKFKRRVVEIGYPEEIWAVDTFYLPSIKFSNNQITTALICKDIASHYIFCRPVRSKKSEDMTKAFLSIIAENHRRSPRKIFSDAGSELNCISKSLSELEIIRYSVKNKDIKTGPIENSVL